jgi:hypothetical protein
MGCRDPIAKDLIDLENENQWLVDSKELYRFTMYALIIIKTTCTSCHGHGTFEALNSIYGEKSQLESEKEVEKIKHSIYNGGASTRTSERLRLDSVSRALMSPAPPNPTRGPLTPSWPPLAWTSAPARRRPSSCSKWVPLQHEQH